MTLRLQARWGKEGRVSPKRYPRLLVEQGAESGNRQTVDPDQQWGRCQQRGRPQPLFGVYCDVILVILGTERPPTQAHGHSQRGR